MTDCKTYYDVLGVDAGVDSGEVKRAFHQKALIYHPDRVTSSKKKWAHNKFVELGNAYETLIDPAKRKEYDDFLAGSAVKFEEPVYSDEDLREAFRSAWKFFGLETDFDSSFQNLFGRDFSSFIRESRKGVKREEEVMSIIRPFWDKLNKGAMFFKNKVQSFISSHIPAYSRSKILKSAIDNALLFGGIAFCSRAFIAFLAPPLRIYHTGGFWAFLWGGKSLYLLGMLIGLGTGLIVKYIEHEDSNYIFKGMGLGLLAGVLLMFLTRLIDSFIGNAFFRMLPPIVGWTVFGIIAGALFGNIKILRERKYKDKLWIPVLISAGILLFQLFFR